MPLWIFIISVPVDMSRGEVLFYTHFISALHFYTRHIHLHVVHGYRHQNNESNSYDRYYTFTNEAVESAVCADTCAG